MLAAVSCSTARTNLSCKILSKISLDDAKGWLAAMPAAKPLRTRQGFEHRWPQSYSEAFLASAVNA